MQIEQATPCSIRIIENVWIPMSDGSRLAARVWMPEDAEDNPVPAILEYLPYRKNDLMAIRDSIHHGWYATQGFAGVRVDIRGSGDSDGVLRDEYTQQEQDDGMEIIAWLAAQPWCSGSVGMMGISWGGFNSLQMAARRPPALKAIIPHCATDDRYADDAHYAGGCLLAISTTSWGGIFFAHNCLPPDPDVYGERWRDLWFERMEAAQPPAETWLKHQRRDAYWQHGSVCEDFSTIDIPVYAVGGWADGYTNSVRRTVAGLSGPRKGLIGPWSHNYPEAGVPGPAVDFLKESKRWWDHWLKGIDTGIMDEPMLRVWMQDSVPPQTSYAERPGRWIAEPSWPPPAQHSTPQTYYLNEQGLGLTSGDSTQISFQTLLTHGMYAGSWCPFGSPGELPDDQRLEDGTCQTFTTAPLAEAVEIFGAPTVTLAISVDRPNAMLAVRLCDVAPTGASKLVTRGFLNLTHRDGHELPTAIEPGKQYTVTVKLDDIAHVVPAGHRWRLAVATSHWPMVWPSPEPVTLTVHCGEASQLTLPVRPPQASDAELPAFEPVVEPYGPTMSFEPRGERDHQRRIEQDLLTGEIRLIDSYNMGGYRLDNNKIETGISFSNTVSIKDNDPLSAKSEFESTFELGRGEWQTKVRNRSVLSADLTHFHLQSSVEAYEGDKLAFSKEWTASFARDFL